MSNNDSSKNNLNVIVINTGSTSLKMSNFTVQEGKANLVRNVEQNIDWDKLSDDETEQKMSQTFEQLIQPPSDSRHELIVGHRIVHGGPNYTSAVEVSETVLHDLEKLNDFAPLHNPINLRALKIARKLMPKATHVAAFDTAFHTTIPPEVSIYAGPYYWYEDLKIKKYGFHGLSHKHCANFARDFISKTWLGKPRFVISCHLGGGCSLAAIRDGISVDTTMGFTPLDGLMMRSRSGSVDPGLLIYLLKEHKYSVEDLDIALNKKSGLTGIFEKTGDMKSIIEAMNNGDARAKLAFDMFVERIISFIGAAAATMGGLDALIFTGGIGERSPEVRSAVCDRLKFLGVKLDFKLNQLPHLQELNQVDEINRAKTNVFHITAQEDHQIAVECLEVFSNSISDSTRLPQN